MSAATTHESKWPTYPAYKPSGIDWLGEVPEHWEVKRLKHVADVRFSNVDKHSHDDEVPVRLCNYTDVYYNEFITKSIEFMEATANEREIRRFSLQPGDVLITKDSEDWNDIAVPALVRDELPNVLCGYHMAQMHPRPDLYSGDYLARAFVSAGIRDQFRVAATGVTRYGLPKNALCDALFPLPPLPEQLAIAAFLDERTAKIDALIEAKRELLARLKEKRQALITHAVTKGLDPNAKMKPSGIDWLGEVPEHWDCVRTRFLCDTTTGERDTQDAEDEGEYPFFVRSDTIERISTWSFDGEGVLTSGDGAGVGKIYHHYIGKMEIHQRVYLFHNFRRVTGRFFYFYLRANFARVALHGAAKSTVDSLRRPMLLDFPITVPPEDEQRNIVNHIESESGKVDAVISSAKDAINRLTEYRTALISAAVTGKIDVREECVNG